MGVDARAYFLTARRLGDLEVEMLRADFDAAFCGNPPAPPLFRFGVESLHSCVSVFHQGPCRGECGAMPPESIGIDFGGDRRYANGYERGNFILQFPFLSWLRRRPYVVAVFYGGDGGPWPRMQQWTEEYETRLIRHFLTNGQRGAYERSWKPTEDETR